jgi:hypothetical protein
MIEWAECRGYYEASVAVAEAEERCDDVQTREELAGLVCVAAARLSGELFMRNEHHRFSSLPRLERALKNYREVLPAQPRELWHAEAVFDGERWKPVRGAG